MISIKKARSMAVLVAKQLLQRNVLKEQHQLGEYIIDEAISFSHKIGGVPESVDPLLLRYMRRKEDLSKLNRLLESLQCLFMPDYTKHLTDFYSHLQYVIFLNFLSYPFSQIGSLNPYLQTYRDAESKLGQLRVLEFGAGIPYGLIELAKRKPECIESITIIDLKLIHVDFMEYLLTKLCPSTQLIIHRLEDSDDFPHLGDYRYNAIFGKDVFEHVVNPEKKLRKLIEQGGEKCVCYFDLRDHPPAIQHLSLEISKLAKVVKSYGFNETGKISGVSRFEREQRI